ncbi:protein-S-isoprenylcysteine O-methyltransferase Ste14 [Haloactinopolyspora alba]|uniref:Protein-S-isoprenylcysteine O-methyltransferase Ste14 n=1 Tax=Haloactinopolyspora alba TaxID=648780 RepID=A0A2P8DKX5_9ACTN|nr:isoprenylcysteine carboxylmethyltransferase family protein [Haloactinopolyspora alba]PSK97848.1 protein-S-isoprenylcysteine O-methyltransferase Ste14 [Haloactinopolyspora alba]
MDDAGQPSRLPPYLAFFGTLLLIGPVHLVTPGPQLLTFPATLAGLAVIAAGLVLAGGQQRAIGRHGQGGMYTDVPTRLIDDGVFRFSRNPLYLAMVLLTLGIAVLLGSLGALVLVALEFVAMNVWGIPYEERVLAREFGDDYAAYRRRVRRWL